MELSDDFDDYTIETANGEIVQNRKALAKLFADGAVYPITRTVTMDWADDYEQTTTALFVGCNDVFVRAMSDGEPVTVDQIGDLLKAHLSGRFGAIKWVCKQRGLKPIPELQDRIKEAGEWDEQMEQLDENPGRAARMQDDEDADETSSG